MPEKYNIVIVNPDQMRADYCTPAGHPFIETTHLSRLARMGTHFSNAFTTCPMCGPTRASVVTGQYPCEHRVRNYGGTMDLTYPNALLLLREAGYHLAIHGKDHIFRKNPIGTVYHEGENICIGNMDQHPEYIYSWSSGVLDVDSKWNLTERLTTAGLKYIEKRAKKRGPFFLTLNYQDPHPYFTCPEPWASLFSPDQFALPPNFRRSPAEGEPKKLSAWRVYSQSGNATEKDFQAAMAMYAGQVRYVDDQVGRVLDTLEALDLLDSTIVLFWSDHGEFLGDYGVTHKIPAFYDCLIRVPIFLWDPSGVAPRGAVTDLVESMDIFATILDLVGVDQPERSRAQSLLEDSYIPRRDVYAEGGLYLQPPMDLIEGVRLRAPSDPSQYGPGAMLRTREWKLCIHACDVGELYNFNVDPFEMHNCFEDPECRETRDRLLHRLFARQLCQGQAPEHLPKPEVQEISPSGHPVWKPKEKQWMAQTGYDNPYER